MTIYASFYQGDPDVYNADIPTDSFLTSLSIKVSSRSLASRTTAAYLTTRLIITGPGLCFI